MTDPSTHRSRTAWPGSTSVAGVGEGHVHDVQLPPALLRRVRLLTGAVAIFGVCLVACVSLIIFLIQARSAERNAENAATNQRINVSICDLLDQLPEGGLLERPRHKYGCGPGIPIDELPPDVADKLRERWAPASVGVPAFIPPCDYVRECG